MNELETQNLNHQHIIHKSTPILILRGGIAWFLLVISDYSFDQLPALTQWGAGYNVAIPFFSIENLASIQSLFHLLVNVIFGGLILYIVLSWFYEYYIITSDAIIVRKGIIFSREDIYQMEDVKSIDVAQDFWDKIFQTGTVEFYAFRMNRNVYFRDIADPYVVAAHIHERHPSPPGLKWPLPNNSEITHNPEDEYIHNQPQSKNRF